MVGSYACGKSRKCGKIKNSFYASHAVCFFEKKSAGSLVSGRMVEWLIGRKGKSRNIIRHAAVSPALCLTAWSFSFTYKRGIPAPSLFRSLMLTARVSPVYKQKKDSGLPPVAYEKTSCLLCAHGRSGIRLTHYKGGQGCLCEQGENWLQDV